MLDREASLGFWNSCILNFLLQERKLTDRSALHALVLSLIISVNKGVAPAGWGIIYGLSIGNKHRVVCGTLL